MLFWCAYEYQIIIIKTTNNDNNDKVSTFEQSSNKYTCKQVLDNYSYGVLWDYSQYHGKNDQVSVRATPNLSRAWYMLLLPPYQYSWHQQHWKRSFRKHSFCSLFKCLAEQTQQLSPSNQIRPETWKPTLRVRIEMFIEIKAGKQRSTPISAEM